MELSVTQQRVVSLMGEGWCLGLNTGTQGRAWLQWGGVGMGGPTEKVNVTTLFALYKKGVIRELAHKFPTTEYALTATEIEKNAPAK